MCEGTQRRLAAIIAADLARYSLEQLAAIMEDYYRLSQGGAPVFHVGGVRDMSTYQALVPF